jgi:hypothetical protein
VIKDTDVEEDGPTIMVGEAEEEHLFVKIHEILQNNLKPQKPFSQLFCSKLVIRADNLLKYVHITFIDTSLIDL